MIDVDVRYFERPDETRTFEEYVSLHFLEPNRYAK